jgi:hypothetical protein
VEKYRIKSDRPQIKIWRMRIACWITKAKNTHSEYLILDASPLQQWLYERVSLLRYTYIACIVQFDSDASREYPVRSGPLSSCLSTKVLFRMPTISF